MPDLELIDFLQKIARDSQPDATVTREMFSGPDATGQVYVSSAPASGKRLYVMDIVVAPKMPTRWTVREETGGIPLLRGFAPANSTQRFTLRGMLAPAVGKRLIFETQNESEYAVTVAHYSDD